MDREIILENIYSKTPMFILKCNSRYTSKIVGRSTRAWQNIQESVTNLSAFSNIFLKVKSK